MSGQVSGAIRPILLFDVFEISTMEWLKSSASGRSVQRMQRWMHERCTSADSSLQYKRPISQNSPQCVQFSTMFSVTLLHYSIWLLAIINLDFLIAEKPPVLVKSNSIQERLRASTVTKENINTVHFSKRELIAGSSGMVHIGMNTNVSVTLQSMLRGCTIPDKLHKKIKDLIVHRAVAENVVPGYTNASIKASVKPYVHFERIRHAMKRRCIFHLQELIDHMEVIAYIIALLLHVIALAGLLFATIFL